MELKTAQSKLELERQEYQKMKQEWIQEKSHLLKRLQEVFHTLLYSHWKIESISII